MRIAVIKHLINRAELQLVIPPDLLAERFLRDDLRYVAADIIERAILRIIRIILCQTQTPSGTITQLHKDTLRIVAHVMTHEIAVRAIIQYPNRVRVARDITAHELTPQRQAFHRPTRPVETHQVGHRVMLRIRFLQTRELELVQEERTV